MSDRPAETIQTLLEAEEEAKRVIDAARAERDARLKAAVDEADAEIEAFKTQKELEYKAQVATFAGAAGSESTQISADAKLAIQSTLAAATIKKPAVLDLLVGHVTNVDTTVPTGDE